MPIYDWVCPQNHEFVTVKSMSEYEPGLMESCPECCELSTRDLSKGKTSFYGAKVEDATFHPAFGKVIRNSKHAQEEAKSRGMIELGNESPDKIHSGFERQRQETRVARYEDAMREKVYGD